MILHVKICLQIKQNDTARKKLSLRPLLSYGFNIIVGKSTRYFIYYQK